MGSFTDVDALRLTQEAAAIRQNIATLRSMQTALGNILTRLGPHWQGEAHQLFTRQFQDYTTSLTRLISEHERLNNDHLAASGTRYRDADERVRARINQLPW